MSKLYIVLAVLAVVTMSEAIPTKRSAELRSLLKRVFDKRAETQGETGEQDGQGIEGLAKRLANLEGHVYWGEIIETFQNLNYYCDDIIKIGLQKAQIGEDAVKRSQEEGEEESEEDERHFKIGFLTCVNFYKYAYPDVSGANTDEDYEGTVQYLLKNPPPLRK